jgi:hypothetical protein
MGFDHPSWGGLRLARSWTHRVRQLAFTAADKSDFGGRKGGLFVAIILLAIGVVLQMVVIGSSA